MKLSAFPDKAEFLDMAEKGSVVPVCVEILADTETPVSLLMKHQDSSGPMFLLESVEGGERWGRYSFLGTRAKYEVKVFPESVSISGTRGEERIEHGGNPTAALRDFMARFIPVAQPRLPRFWGGLVGYLSYEAVSFFERIENRLPRDEPLAHFLVTGDLYVFDNLRHTLTLVSHAFLDNGENPEAQYDKAVERLCAMRGALDRPVPRPDAPRAEPGLVPRVDPEDFRQRVKRVKEYIRAGEIIQAVISQSFGLSPVVDPVALYRAQRYVNPSPYMFFLRTGDMSLVGSSPETMVRLESGTATLRPIAGTRPRGADQQADRALADELLADPKERAEHLMLVDLGRNDLGRVAATGTVQVTDLMVVERYSHVMHLVSNISAELDEGKDGWDLLAATFPAGTLSGAPKVRAMEIITEMEDEPRGPYGGAVGYVSFTGNMDLAITIRTAVAKNGSIVVRAGAGIVADSDPESERVECVNKARAIERAMRLVCGEGRETP
ncbi:MAG: chorismate-binding protein [Deltaproteobacteria bacterium]|nr:chorismate-binding protein [Deltaproteobacteria bacterium]